MMLMMLMTAFFHLKPLQRIGGGGGVPLPPLSPSLVGKRLPCLHHHHSVSDGDFNLAGLGVRGVLPAPRSPVFRRSRGLSGPPGGVPEGPLVPCGFHIRPQGKLWSPYRGCFFDY